MKLNRDILPATLKIWLLFFKYYFLGGSDKNKKAPIEGDFLGIDLKRGPIVVLGRPDLCENEGAILSHLKVAKTWDYTVVLLHLPNPDHLIDHPQKHPFVLSLRPPHLEASYGMTKLLHQTISGPVILILANMSRLASFKEQKLQSFMPRESHIHNRAVYRLLVKLLRVHKDKGWDLIVIDDRASLGKKNSAFLERVSLGTN